MRRQRPHNQLLAALSFRDFSRLAPHLTTVPLPLKHVLYRPGDPIPDVYFPNGGMCSVVATLSSGASVEVAAVGDEGMIGVEAFFTTDAVSVGETMVQVPGGDAERLDVDAFRRELASGPFRDVVGRYLQAKITEFVQSAACNALHTVQQRCARWLLQVHDRVHRSKFDLSHEFLAVMLGANRSTVSTTAGALQSAGLIRYRRAHVEILDRHKLEAEACECYARIRAAFAASRPAASPRR